MSTKFISPQEVPLISATGEVIVTLKDNSVVKMNRPTLINDKLVGATGNQPRREIDLSQVRSVQLVHRDYFYPVLYAGVAGVAAFLLVGATTAPAPPPSESCPFIYAFDGEHWVFEAEPFGGAFSQALERVEWCRLDQIREDQGRYKILVANELEETQYTDELKLVVADHPRGLAVAFNPAGQIHTFSNPLPPFRAYDASGKDLLSLVRASDHEFWQSAPEGVSPSPGADWRDELVLEFPKPPGARTAKVLANVWTSARGSLAAKSFLELYGKSLPDFYAEVNRFGPAYNRLRAWFLKEELYLLRIAAETKDGWKTKGVLYGGGPFIAKEKAYLIDVSDVEGDVLRIKLRPPKNFWLINSLAVDYSEDIPVQTRELSPRLEEFPSGSDFNAELNADDNRYLVLEKKGDRAEIAFVVPPLSQGADRTIFVKARGFYNIHLDARGEPRWDILAQIYDQPGFCVRYAEARFRSEFSWAKADNGRSKKL
jgi:hypothetical protein